MSIGAGNASLLLPIGLSLVAFASFSWALRGHFQTGHLPNAMRLLSGASLLAYIAYLAGLIWGNRQSLGSTTLGLIGLVLSLALFWWTVTTTRQHRLRLAYADADPDIIYSHGPYARVRHPFYLSYIIFWISAALIAGPWQWVPTAILVLWYVRIALTEEKRFRSSTLSGEYDAYRRRTGMLLPRLVATQILTCRRSSARQ
jgi:protein-S-isoprenylcysteine O-methyltransferase Ste14